MEGKCQSYVKASMRVPKLCTNSKGWKKRKWERGMKERGGEMGKVKKYEDQDQEGCVKQGESNPTTNQLCLDQNMRKLPDTLIDIKNVIDMIEANKEPGTKAAFSDFIPIISHVSVSGFFNRVASADDVLEVLEAQGQILSHYPKNYARR